MLPHQDIVTKDVISKCIKICKLLKGQLIAEEQEGTSEGARKAWETRRRGMPAKEWYWKLPKKEHAMVRGMKPPVKALRRHIETRRKKFLREKAKKERGSKVVTGDVAFRREGIVDPRLKFKKPTGKLAPTRHKFGVAVSGKQPRSIQEEQMAEMERKSKKITQHPLGWSKKKQKYMSRIGDQQFKYRPSKKVMDSYKEPKLPFNLLAPEEQKAYMRRAYFARIRRGEQTAAAKKEWKQVKGQGRVTTAEGARPLPVPKQSRQYAPSYRVTSTASQQQQQKKIPMVWDLKQKKYVRPSTREEFERMRTALLQRQQQK